MLNDCLGQDLQKKSKIKTLNITIGFYIFETVPILA